MVAVLPPIAQDPAYHRFSDQRLLHGVPNFWNVVSNAPFALVGGTGLLVAIRSTRRRLAWIVFFGAEVATAFGSAYYHARPANGTLAWDRLPLAVMLAAFFATAVGERIESRFAALLLWPAVGIAVASVLYWARTDDLRPYVFVQFYPVLAVPLIAALYPSRDRYARTLPATWMLYAVAKACELGDRHAVLGLSGHTWKHLVGAAASAVLLYGFAGSVPDRNTAVVRPGTLSASAA